MCTRSLYSFLHKVGGSGGGSRVFTIDSGSLFRWDGDLRPRERVRVPELLSIQGELYWWWVFAIDPRTPNYVGSLVVTMGRCGRPLDFYPGKFGVGH